MPYTVVIALCVATAVLAALYAILARRQAMYLRAMRERQDVAVAAAIAEELGAERATITYRRHNAGKSAGAGEGAHHA